MQIEDQWQLYKNSFFEIHYPNKWTITTDLPYTLHKTVCFLSPVTDLPFRPNVNIMLQKLHPNTSLAFFGELTLNQVRQIEQNKEVELKPLIIDEREACGITFQLPQIMQGEHYILSVSQAWCIHNEHAIVFTFTNLPDGPNHYFQTAQQMLAQLKMV